MFGEKLLDSERDSGESTLERYERLLCVTVWFVSLLTSWVYKPIDWTLWNN